MPLKREAQNFSDIASTSNLEDDVSNSIPIDWQKLASIELSELASAKEISSSLLSDHLLYISMCDAGKELDLTRPSDQKSLLKLFRIAQMLLQLASSRQRCLEQELAKTKHSLVSYVDKCTQIRSQLHQQVSEAKKMKITNKNLRETVKHINTVAISKGLLQPVKCDSCFKIFRDKSFLEAHQARKHQMRQPSSVCRASDCTQMLRQLKNSDNTNEFGEQRTPAGSTQRKNDESNEIELFFDKIYNCAEMKNKSSSRSQKEEKLCMNAIDASSLPGAFRTNEEPTTSKQLAAVQQTCEQLQTKMKEMMANFKQREVEFKAEHERIKDEYLVVNSEKLILEEKFRAQFDIMNSKIKNLEELTGKLDPLKQGTSSSALTEEGKLQYRFQYNECHDDDSEIHKKKSNCDLEVVINTRDAMNESSQSATQAKLIAKKLIDKEKNDIESEGLYNYHGNVALSSITENSAETEENCSKEDSICDVKSLSLDENSEFLREENPYHPEDAKKDEIFSKNTTKNRRSNGLQFKNLPPRPPSQAKERHERVRFLERTADNSINSETTASEEKGAMAERKTGGKDDMSESSESDSQESSNQKTKKIYERRSQDSNKIASEFNKIKNDEWSSPDTDDEAEDLNKVECKKDSDDDEDSGTIKDASEQRFDEILKSNPEIWTQLRSATKQVVDGRLVALNIHGRVDEESYKKAARELKRQRNSIARNYSNFRKLRKTLHHEVKAKIKLQMKTQFEERNENVRDKSKSKTKTFSMFKSVTHKVKSNMAKKSHRVEKITDAAYTAHMPSSTAQIPQVSDDTASSHSENDEDNDTVDQILQDTVDDNILTKGENVVEDNAKKKIRKGHNDENLCGVDNFAYVASGESERDEEEASELSNDDTSVKGIDNLAYSHSVAESSFDKHEDEIEDFTEYSSEEFSEAKPVEPFRPRVQVEKLLTTKPDEPLRPRVQVEKLFKTSDLRTLQDEDNTESFDQNADAVFENYREQEYKPIKLKQPTGQRIIQLKAKIESQLQQRRKKGPAGSVNTVLEDQDGSDSQDSNSEDRPDFDTKVEAFDVSSDT